MTIGSRSFLSYVVGFSFLPGGASTGEFFIKHFVKLRYLVITHCNSVPPTKCCSVFYRTLTIIQAIFRRQSTVPSSLVLKLMFSRCILSFMLTTVYDYELKAKEDRIVDVMIRYADLVTESLAPGPAALMETFPFRSFAH